MVKFVSGGTDTEQPSIQASIVGPYVRSVNGETGDIVIDLSSVGSATNVDWETGVINKPSEFPPLSHTHLVGDIDGLIDLLNDKIDNTDPRLSDARNPLAHTHTTTDVTDFTEAVQDAVAAMLVSGAQVSLTYDDTAGSLVVAATGADAETMRDTVGAALVGINGVSITVNDAADTITIGITGLTIAQITGLQGALDSKALLTEAVNTVATSGSAVTLPDVTTATIHDVTLTANCTFTFPTVAAGKSFTVRLTQDATGSRTVTWPATVKWPSGSAPVLSTGATKQDVLSFVSIGGTTWSGFLAGQDMR